LVFKTNKQGQKFNARPTGKRISQSFNVNPNEHLTMDQVNKILKDRNIDPEDIIFEGDQEDGRVISLHPSNELLDNIIVKKDSAHKYDERDLIGNEKLSQKLDLAVGESKEVKPEEQQEKKPEKKTDKKKKEKK